MLQRNASKLAIFILCIRKPTYFSYRLRRNLFISKGVNVLHFQNDSSESDFNRNKKKSITKPIFLFSGDRGLVIFSNCDDEEDCIQGSGSGDGATGGSSNLYPGSNNPNSKNGENNQAKNNEEVFYPGGTDSEFFFSYKTFLF